MLAAVAEAEDGEMFEARGETMALTQRRRERGREFVGETLLLAAPEADQVMMALFAEILVLDRAATEIGHADQPRSVSQASVR